jgi:hypothetical protein
MRGSRGYLEALLEDLSCLLATDSDVDGDLLISADTECPHGVAGCGMLGCE